MPSSVCLLWTCLLTTIHLMPWEGACHSRPDLRGGERARWRTLGVHERGDEKSPAAVRDLVLDYRGRIGYQKLARDFLIW